MGWGLSVHLPLKVLMFYKCPIVYQILHIGCRWVHVITQNGRRDLAAHRELMTAALKLEQTVSRFHMFKHNKWLTTVVCHRIRYSQRCYIVLYITKLAWWFKIDIELDDILPAYIMRYLQYQYKNQSIKTFRCRLHLPYFHLQTFSPMTYSELYVWYNLYTGGTPRLNEIIAAQWRHMTS